jgi:DNA-binding transcriptional ArsR family regulator
MTQAATEQVYRAVSDPTRRAMLDYLRTGPQTVNALAERFPVSRPAVSKHLRILRQARLVRQKKHGRERIHELNAEPLRELDRWLADYRRFWKLNLSSLKKFVEENPE